MEGLVISGVLVSQVSFTVAAVLLYKLSLRLTDDPRLAYWSALAFIWQPCMMFMSAVYSESLFAALSFAGMLQFERGRWWMAAVWFALSSAVRSNGALYGGYFVYAFLCQLTKPRAFQMIRAIIRMVLLVTLSMSGMLAFQWYGYRQFCVGVENNARPWCRDRIPLIYSFVQQHYW
jgi:phosphatidylinositol glycan class V